MKHIAYCPNEACSMHHNPSPKDRSWYSKRGFQQTRKDKKLQRYRCNVCGKNFTKNTFSIDYYVEKYVDYRKLLELFITGSGIREMARTMGLHRNTITNRLQRLARQIMAVMAEEIQDFILHENMAADGLETYIHSRFILDSNSFVYRRKGCSTEELYQIARFEPYAASKRFHSILETAAMLINQSDKKSSIPDTDENPIDGKPFSIIDWFDNKIKHRLANTPDGFRLDHGSAGSLAGHCGILNHSFAGAEPKSGGILEAIG